MKKHLHLRSLSLLLIFLLLLSVFSGCDTGKDNETTEITTEAETEPVYRDLFVDGKTSYKLIYPYEPTQEIFDATIYLQETIAEFSGIEMEYADDFYNPFKETLPETAYEILIGDTNRVETADAKALIRGKDFIIYEKNNRIAIVGGDESKTIEAVQYFIDTYFNLDTRNITVTEGMQDISRHSYDIGVISIDGVEISNYAVVVPEAPDTLFPYYAALNLIDLLSTEAGVVLPLIYDSEEPREYEIVIGETTRAESKSAKGTALEDNQYILKKVGNSIYMYGKDYMVGGAVSDLVNNYIIGANDTSTNTVEVTGLPTSNLVKTFSFPKEATSALILIGDGMGLNHVEMTFKDRDDRFLAEYLDNVGLCTTFPYGGSATSTGYTDSAASATALATGYKTKNNYLGLDHNGQKLLNIRELASSVGAKTAILTTDVITGATPAGFLCHHKSRKATADLQKQINQLRYGGDKNLLFATSVEMDKTKLLPETREILYTLADEGETYFAMIEEAYIDKESHSNNAKPTKNCVLRYNDVIGYTVQFVMLHPETALIITADHECGGLYIEGNQIYYTSTNHTNAMVPVYAIGPGTEMFKGQTVDNTDIGKFMGSIYTDSYFGDPSLD